MCYFDDCEFYPADGTVLVGTPTGARVQITSAGVEGYSDATTKEFYLRTSDGRAMFGGGHDTLDASGLVLSGVATSYNTYNGINWQTVVDPPGGNIVARVSAGLFQYGGPELDLIANPNNAYTSGRANMGANGDAGHGAAVTAYGGSSVSWAEMSATDSADSVSLLMQSGAGSDQGITLRTGGYARLTVAYAGSVTRGNGTNAHFDTVSDKALKTDIADLSGSLAKITALRPRSYNMKDTGEKVTGFVAQEFGQVFPEAVTLGDDGLYSLNTSCIHEHLVGAVIELEARLAKLEAR
jgi:hypothetical protein